MKTKVTNRFFCGGYEFHCPGCAAQHGELMNEEVIKECYSDDPVFRGVFRYVDGGFEYVGDLDWVRPASA